MDQYLVSIFLYCLNNISDAQCHLSDKNIRDNLLQCSVSFQNQVQFYTPFNLKRNGESDLQRASARAMSPFPTMNTNLFSQTHVDLACCPFRDRDLSIDIKMFPTAFLNTQFQVLANRAIYENFGDITFSEMGFVKTEKLKG